VSRQEQSRDAKCPGFQGAVKMTTVVGEGAPSWIGKVKRWQLYYRGGSMVTVVPLIVGRTKQLTM